MFVKVFLTVVKLVDYVGLNLLNVFILRLETRLLPERVNLSITVAVSTCQYVLDLSLEHLVEEHHDLDRLIRDGVLEAFIQVKWDHDQVQDDLLIAK